MQWSHLLTDLQVLGVMSAEGRGLFRGCYWGELTRHGVIDIDQGSKYHNSQELAELNHKFAAVGLILVPFQSSSSGGWHLYYFLDDWAASHEIGSTIKAWLFAQGYEIKSGTLEIFPSKNALRLPLQQGFAWLGHDGRVIRTREQLTQEEAISSFLINFENNSSNWPEAKALIDSQLELTRAVAGRRDQEHREAVTIDGLGDFFTKGLDHEKYQRGRQYWLNGLSGRNQRHDAVICLGHWLWYGDRSLGIERLPGLRNAGLRAEMIQAWLQEKHNGHSKAVNLGRRSEIEGQILRACQWASQRPAINVYEPYPLTTRLLKRLEWLYQKTGKLWTIEALEKANTDRSLEARSRIAEAVSFCLETGMQISRNGLAEIARCSPNTISKHRDLWCCLETGSGVSTNGGFGGSFLPPLLLAASLEPVSDQSASVLTGSETVVEIFPFDFAESFDCSSGSQSAASRPASENVISLFAGSGQEENKAKTAFDWGSCDLVLVDSLNFPVAPLFQAWQPSQPESAQCQAQALRVPLASLTLGPKLSGFQALLHDTAGGIFLSSGVGLVGNSGDSRQFTGCLDEVFEESGVVSGSYSQTLQLLSGCKVSPIIRDTGNGSEKQPGRPNRHDKGSVERKMSPGHCRGP